MSDAYSRSEAERHGLNSGARVTINLSVAQAISLARTQRQACRKTERQLQKSTFIPEPGQRHAGEAALKKQRDLLDTPLAAIGIDELDGGRDVDSLDE